MVDYSSLELEKAHSYRIPNVWSCWSPFSKNG